MVLPLETIFEAAGYIVSGAAILAAALPSPKADKASKALLFTRKVIDFLGMNFANAKNASKQEANGQAQQEVK